MFQNYKVYFASAIGKFGLKVVAHNKKNRNSRYASVRRKQKEIEIDLRTSKTKYVNFLQLPIYRFVNSSISLKVDIL